MNKFLMVTCLMFVHHFSFGQITFSDQTNLMINPINGSGVAIGVADMNGDGLDDIVHYHNGFDLSIEYQTTPNATFTTYHYGQVHTSSEWSTCIADYDQNGYNDILVGGLYDPIKILTADNTGSSLTVSFLPGSPIFIQGSNFADINNDGWVDVFACHDDAESRIWENDGNGGFVAADTWIDMTTTPASDNSGNYASIWTDYDHDGDLDLYISKCRGGASSPTDPRRINALFQNDGNNNFTEVAAQANLKFGDQSWATDFADIDNDGDLDAFVINHGSTSLLMENDGNGVFTNISAGSGLNMPNNKVQAIFRDFDNDGYVDLLTAGASGQLFRNNGNNTFTDIGFNFINSTKAMESFAIGDLNDDGYPDIYGGYANIYTSPSGFADIIWMNDGGNNNYFDVLLEGTNSNINGIGARLELKGAWGTQTREVRSGEGYGIMNSFKQHFGLGTETQITELIVTWPSGTVDYIYNPTINQSLNLVEGSHPFCGFYNPSVYPNAPELCDGLDNDCNGLIDDNCLGLPECEDLILNVTQIDKSSYHASEEVISAIEITNGMYAVFTAGDVVTLDNGFTVPANTSFLAENISCELPTASSIPNREASEIKIETLLKWLSFLK